MDQAARSAMLGRLDRLPGWLGLGWWRSTLHRSAMGPTQASTWASRRRSAFGSSTRALGAARICADQACHSAKRTGQPLPVTRATAPRCGFPPQ